MTGRLVVEQVPRPSSGATRVPTDMATLATLIMETDDAAVVNRLFDRLADQEGHEEAARLWQSACSYGDRMGEVAAEEERMAQARVGLERAWAARGIRSAVASLPQDTPHMLLAHLERHAHAIESGAVQL